MLVPWLDNFIGGANTRETLECIESELNNCAREIGLAFKPCSTAGPGEPFEALGIIYTDDSASVADKSDPPKVVTTRDAAVLIGKCIWLNYVVVRKPLCTVPQLLESATNIGKAALKEGWKGISPLSSADEQALRGFWECGKEVPLQKNWEF